MKSLLLTTAIALSIAATPAFAKKEGFVTVTVSNISGVPNGRVAIPIGIAAQVCGVSASKIAKHRDSFHCTVTQPHVTRSFLNFVTKNKS
jgi:hypothetical protein